MQTRAPFFDEIAKAMEQAIGIAQAAGDEAKTAMRAQADRLAAELDLVRRDELDALRATFQAELAELRAEVARLAFERPSARPPHDGG